ncbi:unnamed protein product [Meganyctiphanes norvegica]|uniref:Secreted protein n=1 Tax=Meganyctiphanes norvegica TaxID=48144 RepID=A0AAV2QPP4_MEGNR
MCVFEIQKVLMIFAFTVIYSQRTLLCGKQEYNILYSTFNKSNPSCNVLFTCGLVLNNKKFKIIQIIFYILTRDDKYVYIYNYIICICISSLIKLLKNLIIIFYE